MGKGLELPIRKPGWINKKIDFKYLAETGSILSSLNIHTVCYEARCPNISECFKNRRVTFLILGDICTRHCSFCNIKHGNPLKPDHNEPERIAAAVKKLNLTYVVITSVSRDDLADGGANNFAQTVRKIKEHNDEIKIEVLTPDFKGNLNAVKQIVDSVPDIFGHNIETVQSLESLRSRANYNRSMFIIKNIKKFSEKIYSKSAIMLGLGEKDNEVVKSLKDLRENSCDFLSIGQYLQPNKQAVPVKEYLKPEKFQFYKKKAYELGFLHVESGPYVRSSYMADNYI